MYKVDTVLVREDKRIPANGITGISSTAIDDRAIIGESIPANKYNSKKVFVGTVHWMVPLR